MSNYGVLPQGFRRKPLAVIMAELQDAAVGLFGEQVVTTPQSPAGQLLGLFGDALAENWEETEGAYQSYDPDEAEGTRLDILAQVRLIERGLGESDADFARAITNRGVANIRDAEFYREVMAIPGVEWARIYANETGAVDVNGMPRNSVTVAALGGDDEAVALVSRRFIVPGITKIGNVVVNTEVDGFCRSIGITRPTVVPHSLDVVVKKSNDATGCPPPSNAAIGDTLHAALSGPDRVRNGGTLDIHRVRMALCAFPSVEVQSFRVWSEAIGWQDGGRSFPFYEMPSFSRDDIRVTA